MALFAFKAAFIITLVNLKPAVSQVFFILTLLVFISYFIVILIEPYLEKSDMTVSISCWISLMLIAIFGYGAEYDTLNAERGSENLDSFIATALIGATLLPLVVTVYVTFMTWYVVFERGAREFFSLNVVFQLRQKNITHIAHLYHKKESLEKINARIQIRL